MTVSRREGFSATDPDFAAIYVAVRIILASQKPKKREKLYRTLENVATMPQAIGALPHHMRAASCLREALLRWKDIQQASG